jgi:hypothetical protein
MSETFTLNFPTYLRVSRLTNFHLTAGSPDVSLVTQTFEMEPFKVN